MIGVLKDLLPQKVIISIDIAMVGFLFFNWEKVKDFQGFMKIMILSFTSQTFSLSFILNVTLRFDQSKYVMCSPKQNFDCEIIAHESQKV